ncbi:MAG: membrane-bound lytic murein transglycosylase MltF [Betaproteobacteria bacterium]|nr:membrane-bound lytic murein transglycosylase MltF [Betaproteobacteria bacterium]
MVTQRSPRTVGHLLLNLFLDRPERAFVTLLALLVAIVLWSYFRTAGRDGAIILSEAPILAPVSNLESVTELVVATRLGPTTYLTQPDGRTVGLEHDLALKFGEYLGKPVRFLVLDNLDQVLKAVSTQRAHLAAAAVHVSPQLSQRFEFTVPYQQSRPQIVFNATTTPAPQNAADLVGKRLGVVPDPVHLAILEKLRTQYPGLTWKAFPRGDVDLDLLQQVFEGRTQYALSDSNTVSIAQNYYPDLGVAFDVGPSEPIAWAFPKNTEDPLVQAARNFFGTLNRSGGLARMVELYYGHINALDHEDSSAFLQKMVSRLPHFSPVFKHAQEITTLDWRLIAAMAYQESQWDNEAVSPTGVRGIMMLTADTADRLHVSNRLDPKEAIPAAARYLQQLREMIPVRVPEPDRTWMALASYNVGFAHLEDARILAQRNRLNPDSWSDVKRMLPLLSTPEVYNTTRAGFARGGEPVIFVENVRSYYDILARFEKPYRPLGKTAAGLAQIGSP